MQYLSTRGGSSVSPAQAILNGICPSGGLYVPETFPQLSIAELCAERSYRKTALSVMRAYLPDTDEAKLASMISEAYGSFDSDAVAPVKRLSQNECVAELWHGPTMAFKDVALQMLPRLMRDALDQTGVSDTLFILVATSGDTGKAALSGFQDVEGTRVLVFYPHGGVSEAQRLQMVTQEGKNVDVCAVTGNFDDAQTGVKRIFASAEAKERLGAIGYRLSSANSINFGRLLPQIVYYFTSYGALVEAGSIKVGDPINFCVPTGNFGDILAGEYARRMGLPVHKLICASNRNNVLSDFFHTGVYDDRRTFYRSMSCSIDILISSNLERLLFELDGRETSRVIEKMRLLRETGRYAVSSDQRAELQKTFAAGWCDETDTLRTIRNTFDSNGYLIDPHTAVAQRVLERYRTETGDETQTVLLSTANPYKFATHVLSAFETPDPNDFVNVSRLFTMTNAPVPRGVSELLGKPERHLGLCALADMEKRVLSSVGA